MNVTDAILSRRSVRAFQDTPVSRELIEFMLKTASRAPTGGNLQPWHVYVAGGEVRDRLIRRVAEQLPLHPLGKHPEYHVYPPKLQDPYRSRRFKLGEDMYAAIGVSREDREGRLRQFARNWEFFGAPIGLFFTLDRDMQQGQWSDVGMFMQNFMLLARESGLDTCAQESWASWHELVREELAIPDNQILFCGMAVGYADTEHPINNFTADREPLDGFATFKGF